MCGGDYLTWMNIEEEQDIKKKFLTCKNSQWGSN